MPRKTKEQIQSEQKKEPKTTERQTTKKESSTKTPKKVANKAETNKKAVTKKVTSKTTSATKKTTTKKATAKKATSKKSSTKTTTKSTTKAKKFNTTKKKKIEVVEYYDLPYRYNQTIVKVLAQTPKTLFIYWDISDTDREKYKKQYGENFFETTKPILIVHNDTLGYSFEVEINDFANNWYLHVNDANCDYSVELGRRPIEHNSNIDNYVYITTSNNIEMPNNHILFDKLGKSVFFRNVKNNSTIEYPIESISFMKKLGNVCKLYREIYKNEINTTELHSNNIILNLSSSSSSTFM